jgi:hypothetical protein
MRLITALLAAIILTSSSAVAAPAAAATCTTVWLTTPTIYDELPAGTKRCIDLTDGIHDDQIIRIYRGDDPARAQIDWADRWAMTKTPPNRGRVKTTADSVRALAARHDVRIQFADRDLIGRLGCSSASGFANTVSGAYQTATRHPGQGLARLGTGTTNRCMQDKRTVMNVAKHEMSHALIERICGTTDPPRAGHRVEAVTSAYAMKYLGAGMNDGGMRPRDTDFWRATKIHGGWCG